MATSYVDQVPHIVHVVKHLKPKRILDIGKGFGKYGLLLHEYLGVDTSQRISPDKKMRDQSCIRVDAVEVDADLMLPHMDHFYSEVFQGDIAGIFGQLPRYDLVLMIDVIEHVSKADGQAILQHWLSRHETVLVSTPVSFFEQHLFQSPYEEHVSHWKLKDFQSLGFVSHQYVGGSGIFLISTKRIAVRGFGNSPVQRLRRLARCVRSELRW